jgi:polysaccharide biosynthesis transport protein
MSTMHLATKSAGLPAENLRNATSADNAPQLYDLHEILQVLLRQRKVIFATTLLTLFLAFVVVNSMTPYYTASSLVEINARQARVVDFDSVLTGLPANDETVQTEIAIIKSRNIARRVIERLGLARNPEFNIALRPVGLLQSWQYSLADWLVGDSAVPPKETEGGSNEEAAKSAGLFDEIAHTLAGYLRPPMDEDGTDEYRIKNETDRVIDQYLKNLAVRPESRSRILQISFESEDPKSAAAAANATADFYIVAQLEAKFEATKRATEWLNERVSQLRDEVVVKERAIEEYRAKSGLLQGGRDATLASEQISELNAQHVTEVARLAEARARLRQANNLMNSPSGIESSVEVLQSPLILQLRNEEALVERRIAELSEEYGESHPTLINARAELKDLQTKIKLEVARIIDGLRNEVAIADARASSLAVSLEKQKKEMAVLNQSGVELRALELDANASRTLLENLLERTKQTTSQESFQQADANIISYAVEPKEPSFPVKSLMLSLALVLGITLGVTLAFAIEHLDFGFRSGEQISRILGVRSLGLLPRVSKIASAGKAPYDYILNHPNSAYSEGIRTLYTNLLLSDVVRRPKVILMISALPNEGKTTVALSLARLLSMAEYNVVVVDCDFRNPTVHKNLGIEPGSGLKECLAAGIPIGEAIQVDKACGAHILNAGAVLRDSLGQFDSEVMQNVLRQLRRQYDLVIMDAAPVFAAADSLFLAQLADKTVFLVRWAKTRRAAARLALQQTLAAKADVAGVLLTMVDVKSHATYGYGDSGVYQGKFKKYYST